MEYFNNILNNSILILSDLTNSLLTDHRFWSKLGLGPKNVLEVYVNKNCSEKPRKYFFKSFVRTQYTFCAIIYLFKILKIKNMTGDIFCLEKFMKLTYPLYNIDKKIYISTSNQIMTHIRLGKTVIKIIKTFNNIVEMRILLFHIEQKNRCYKSNSIFEFFHDENLLLRNVKI